MTVIEAQSCGEDASTEIDIDAQSCGEDASIKIGKDIARPNAAVVLGSFKTAASNYSVLDLMLSGTFYPIYLEKHGSYAIDM